MPGGKRRILEALSDGQWWTMADLQNVLGTTAPTIRSSLVRLQKQGCVLIRVGTAPRGRPPVIYQVTEKGIGRLNYYQSIGRP